MEDVSWCSALVAFRSLSSPLGSAPTGTRLEIRGDGMRLGEVGVASLCMWLRSLEVPSTVTAWVDLRGSEAGDQGAAELAACLEELGAETERLWLDAACLGRGAAAALQRLAARPALQELRMADNSLDDEAAFGLLSAVAEGAMLRGLVGPPTVVVLARNAVRDPAAVLERLRQVGIGVTLQTGARGAPKASEPVVRLSLPGFCEQRTTVVSSGGGLPEESDERKRAHAEQLMEALSALTEAAAAGGDVTGCDAGGTDIAVGRPEDMDLGLASGPGLGPPTVVATSYATASAPCSAVSRPCARPGLHADWDPYLATAVVGVQGMAPQESFEGLDSADIDVALGREVADALAALRGLLGQTEAQEAGSLQQVEGHLQVATSSARRSRPQDPRRLARPATTVPTLETDVALSLPSHCGEGRETSGGAAIDGVGQARRLAEYEALLLGAAVAASAPGAKRNIEDDQTQDSSAPWRSQRRRFRPTGS
mmetsp:Transcript_7896/g.23934  ORF Transcript_7896/g.23934 Transcript_7896/m.23934 type:complete len:483 (+) Transcript_7896:107-1555(+)